MANHARLGELLAGQKFQNIESIFRRHFQLGLEITDSRGMVLDEICSSDCQPQFCQIVRQTEIGDKRCGKQRKQCLGIAVDTGQSYITVCHAGIVLAAVPVVDERSVMGCVFFGKCLWEPLTPELVNDIKKRLKDVPVDQGQLIQALQKLPVIQGRQIQRAGEFLFDLLYEISGIDSHTIRQRRPAIVQPSQDEIEPPDQSRNLTAGWQSPSASQVELAAKIRIGDVSGARQILDAIAGKILVHHTEGLGLLKARFVELLGFLSRSAAECGVTAGQVLEKNAYYIEQLKQICDKPQLCRWIGDVFNEFIEITYNCQDAKKIVQIRPAINYIDANFDKEMTIAEVARACHLSPSRLAHVFKEYMGITIIDYLNNVRMERAKRLLLTTEQSCTEICYEVGFNNQSYFIRAFKNFVGTTPAKYRTENKPASQ